jgi:pimeloyl-ACP methyl ester carboxylesterase
MERSSKSFDYQEFGAGATIVLVPGSCSTGAAWRPVVTALRDRFRCVTTSLLGYGETAERRSPQDASISHEAELLEAVIRRTGEPVHLVGHSFGGLVSLAVALRRQVPLQSLVVIEAPAVELLHERGEHELYGQFRQMTDAYFSSFEAGDPEAIGPMIDFYGGPGTFASWPHGVRAYAIETTPVNILDWQSAYGFPFPARALEAIDTPTLVLCGAASHAAVQRANVLISESVRAAALTKIAGAAHFMIVTHASKIAGLIAEHVAMNAAGVPC